MGLGLVAIGDICVCLTNWDNLTSIRVVGSEVEVTVDKGVFARRPGDHFSAKADLDSINDLWVGECSKLFMGEERTGSSSGSSRGDGCHSRRWLGLLGSGSSEAFRLTRFAHDRPAEVGGGLVGGWFVEGGDRWGRGRSVGEKLDGAGGLRVLSDEGNLCGGSGAFSASIFGLEGAVLEDGGMPLFEIVLNAV